MQLIGAPGYDEDLLEVTLPLPVVDALLARKGVRVAVAGSI
jgi:hypothetical protein